jgi:hypothetical protein
MARAIWKYDLRARLFDDITVSMPTGARVLCVQVQQGVPRLWALVDTEAPVKARSFRIVGTGHVLGDDADVWRYIGTFQLHRGALVFHVFEVL